MRHERNFAEGREENGLPAERERPVPVLEVRNLKVSYSASGPQILKGIDFAVDGDDFCAVIGPSGAGKSTLIRCVNRLVEASDGDIILFGQDVRKLNGGELRRMRRRIGMIFQEFNLVNRMSVMDNVLSGRLGYTGAFRSLFKVFPREDIERALELLERVGLQDHVDKRADELSGGQRQRVGIARALMQKPEILLLDEPTSALDPKISRDVMRLIKELAREFRVPVLCNIHDVQLALETCNRIIGLQDGYKKFDGPAEGMRKQDLDEIYAMEVL
ncbi:phosphonate transport system ATP-binding protein [Aminobacter sp. J15]|nr:phosphonate transport system ATP-binding protein [Aminobacter sp. J44]TWH31252.1 phosphonate transport system ATP-binding protein [Aminobacter sp. J15]